MDKWRKEIVTRFGKRVGRRWAAAATDIQLVDIGVKPAVLFDHWSVSATDMQAFVSELHKQNLIRERLGVLSIGLDVILYHYKSFETFPTETCITQHFVDVTSSLESPIIIDSDKLFDTTNIFNEFCHWLRKSQDDALNSIYDIQIDEKLNVPCLFGLLLGYPCVYWYDRNGGEENCLSGQTLHLFQIKSSITGKDNFKSNLSHIILSFSVPENLIDCVRNNVLEWFCTWKGSKCWLQMFSDVWLEEEMVNPDAVCL